LASMGGREKLVGKSSSKRVVVKHKVHGTLRPKIFCINSIQIFGHFQSCFVFVPTFNIPDAHVMSPHFLPIHT
jgi:hypothetical protein